MGKKHLTKKEEVLERMKRFQKVNRAARIHRENAEKAYIAKGGYMESEDGGKSQGGTDWQDKVADLRKSIQKGKARRVARGREVFKGR